ncbi:MAG: hypothetical protein ACLPVO_15385, partial [Desulfomonilaceae bacterium]
MKPEKAIQTALSGITPYILRGEYGNPMFGNISAGNDDPPAYVVAFLFLNVLKFKNYGPWREKTWWHTYLLFKGTPYILRDFKFGTWTLGAPKTADVDKNVVQELVHRIRSAGRQADKLLKEELLAKVDKGECWINNFYGTLRGAFNYYQEDVRAALTAVEEPDRTLPERMQDRFRAAIAELDRIKAEGGQHWVRLDDHPYNERNRQSQLLGYRMFPLIASFYSFVEFFLDVVFALEVQRISFREFRRLAWQDRF